MRDEFSYGLACNYVGDSAIADGAKCYITWTNPGGGGEYMQVWARSRGGRAIVKIVAGKKLSNFRGAWVPEHVRTWKGVLGAPWWSKKEAIRRASYLTLARETS